MEQPEEAGTSTLDAARAHARSQAEAAANVGRTIPSTSVGDDVVWDETIPVGGYTSRRLPHNAVLQLTDTDGDGCIQLLVFNAATPAERVNVADTVKVQWQAYLDEGALLLSDMGRVLMTLVEDTSARHDCLCGASNHRLNDARYGDGSASGPSPNARDLLALGAAKLGLARRDIGPCVNLFKSVRVQDDGRLELDGAVAPGKTVTLRAEMPVLVVLANTPHPLDDRPTYGGTSVHVTARIGGPASDAAIRTASPERQRAFENTDELLLVAPEWSALVYDEVVAAHAPWSRVVPTGHYLRITDLEGNQAVDCILYDAHNPTHRYSAADTVTAQRNIFLVTGTQLLSNEGVPMMTITSTSCAYHDTVGGACSRESNTLRYGHHTAHQHACVDNFLDGGSRHNLDKRDLVSNINWFMNVPVGADGTLGIVDGISAPGLDVVVRAQMDVLVLISNCPQINNPCNGFNPTPVRLEIWDGPPE